MLVLDLCKASVALSPAFRQMEPSFIHKNKSMRWLLSLQVHCSLYGNAQKYKVSFTYTAFEPDCLEVFSFCTVWVSTTFAKKTQSSRQPLKNHSACCSRYPHFQYLCYSAPNTFYKCSFFKRCNTFSLRCLQMHHERAVGCMRCLVVITVNHIVEMRAETSTWVYSSEKRSICM